MNVQQISRSPRGERGLKFPYGVGDARVAASLPSRGAWVEIPLALNCPRRTLVAPLAGSVG